MTRAHLISFAIATTLVAGCGSGGGSAHSPGTVGSSAAAKTVSDAARRTLSLTARVDFTLKGAQAFGVLVQAAYTGAFLVAATVRFGRSDVLT